MFAIWRNQIEKHIKHKYVLCTMIIIEKPPSQAQQYNEPAMEEQEKQNKIENLFNVLENNHHNWILIIVFSVQKLKRR